MCFQVRFARQCKYRKLCHPRNMSEREEKRSSGMLGAFPRASKKKKKLCHLNSSQDNNFRGNVAECKLVLGASVLQNDYPLHSKD